MGKQFKNQSCFDPSGLASSDWYARIPRPCPQPPRAPTLQVSAWSNRFYLWARQASPEGHAQRWLTLPGGIPLRCSGPHFFSSSLWAVTPGHACLWPWINFTGVPIGRLLILLLSFFFFCFLIESKPSKLARHPRSVLEDCSWAREPQTGARASLCPLLLRAEVAGLCGLLGYLAFKLASAWKDGIVDLGEMCGDLENCSAFESLLHSRTHAGTHVQDERERDSRQNILGYIAEGNTFKKTIFKFQFWISGVTMSWMARDSHQSL